MGSTGRPQYPKFSGSTISQGPSGSSSMIPNFQSQPRGSLPSPSPVYPPTNPPPMQGPPPPLSTAQRHPITNTFPSSLQQPLLEASQHFQPPTDPMFPHGPPPGPPRARTSSPYASPPTYSHPVMNTPSLTKPPSTNFPAVYSSSGFPSQPSSSFVAPTNLNSSFSSPATSIPRPSTNSVLQTGPLASPFVIRGPPIFVPPLSSINQAPPQAPISSVNQATPQAPPFSSINQVPPPSSINQAPPQAPPFSSINQAPPLRNSLAVAPGVYGQPPLQGIQPHVRPEQGSLGGVQALVEEFRSLSMSTVPGGIDVAVDPITLPRPTIDTGMPKSTWAANCHPRFMRLTCNSIPNSQSLAAHWHLPLGVVIHPLAEAPPGEEVPVINFGSSGIVRCRRCRTYVNPYAIFTDNGNRWKCNLCGFLNDVPAEYYCPLDANGRRKDADDRPELSKGSVEFVASTEYMIRPPMPPVYFFLIDVSASAIRAGMLQVAVDAIKSCLDKLPGYPRTQIGFLTFDSALHFYSLKSSLTQPQMMVVTDLEEPFVPIPDELLVNFPESRTVVEALLDSLPSLFQNNANVESALGPALRAVFMIMSQLGGKLLVFQSTLPCLGVGRLKLRGDDPRVYGTDKECSLRSAEDPFYKQMATDFSKNQIGVNIYAFSERYTDLASLGTLAKYTGGQVYHYPSFQPHMHREKLTYELSRDLTRETAWEAVMRTRCGKGMRFNNFHGHFLLRGSDLMAIPTVDCDKAFALQLTLEETHLTTQTVHFQVALLYTSSIGERRIRIHTLAAPVVSDLGDMYRSADIGAIMSLMSRLAIEKTLVSKLDEARQFIQLQLVQCLREYRNIYGVKHSLMGRLIFPESLELLPLYCLALCKTMALRGGYVDVNPDNRSISGYEMMTMSTSRLLNLLYPSLFRVDEHLLKEMKTGADVNNIQTIPLAVKRLDPQGAFLLNDGIRFVLWVGKVLPTDFIVHLLGMEAANSADLSKMAVAEQPNELSKHFMSFLKWLRESDPALHQQCLIVRQGDQPREGILLLSHLVDDRTTASPGYADWIGQIYRQVQQRG